MTDQQSRDLEDIREQVNGIKQRLDDVRRSICIMIEMLRRPGSAEARNGHLDLPERKTGFQDAPERIRKGLRGVLAVQQSRARKKADRLSS